MKIIKKKNFPWAEMGAFLLINFLGIVGLFLIDASNGARNESWNDNFLASLIEMFSIRRINISSKIFVCFFIAWLATIVPLALFIVFRRKNDGSEKQSGFVVGIVAAAVFIIGWATALSLCAAKGAKLSEFFMTWAYFLLSVLFFVAIAAVVYTAVWLLVKNVASKTVSSLSSASSAKTSEPVTDAVAPASPAPMAVPAASLASSAPSVTLAAVTSENNEEIFPALKAIDGKYAEKQPVAVPEASPCSLTELAEGFQSYLSEKQQLYYDLTMLRAFIAGLASSRLIILEGLSGTGKSSLPRYFSEYVGSKAFFAPVQATWRDRTDVLGFYNDFSHTFKETNFLERLYEAGYAPEKFNIMVLDEMNLSRVEYYFADFLSVLEYPSEDWKVTLMQHIDEQTAPAMLEEGKVRIPVNTWFVGTANKDDSTFTITDKVYDRAVVLEFSERNTKVDCVASSEPVSLAPEQLNSLFLAAWERAENRLTPVDLEKFLALADFVYDTFEIKFGNRIMNQINLFVPVFAAAGGKKEEAIDIMFSRKILHKLEGRFEEYIKEGLIKLQNKVTQVYGAGTLTETEEMIKRLLKKLM